MSIRVAVWCQIEKEAMVDIPTIQPFQGSAQHRPFSAPVPSVPVASAVRPMRKSSFLTAEDSAKIFENRDLIFSLLTEDVELLSHPQPTFITPLQSYLKLDYSTSDITALSAMVEGEYPANAQNKANIKKIYQEKVQKHRIIESYLQDEYLVWSCLLLS
jgi:hypothetical protein